ncbi:hypothetical protein M9H77_17401 [Catharanthus roseus]|uniref:Uncharacterized protein n=1 Tax=Catharanthus roseus TaxID=4058 RepID=A0ACC0B4H7_CATRO|nr:hypothetical protein M9H77_17401 [Catharanthus roseus]
MILKLYIYIYIFKSLLKFEANVKSLKVWRVLVKLWDLVMPSGIVICEHMASLTHFATQGEFTNIFFYKKFKYFLKSIFLYFWILTKLTKYLSVSMKSNVRPVCFRFPASIDYGIPELAVPEPFQKFITRIQGNL